MSHYLGGYGYNYICSLTKAIHGYTEHSCKKDADAFSLHGANLRYAVERHLYFKYFHDKDLLSLFEDIQNNNLAKEYIFSDKITKIIASNIFDDEANGSDKEIPVFGNKRASFQEVVKRIVYPIFGIINSFKRIKKQQKNNIYGYIYVIHEKFIRHLRVFYDGGVGYGFLCKKSVICNSLIEQGLSGAIVPVKYSNYILGAIKNEMVNYSGLVLLFNSFFRHLNNTMPKVVVMPEGNASDYEVLNQACKLLNIPTICVQNGWSPVIHPGFRNMSYTKFFAWGDGFINLLQPYNEKQSFVSTGNHVLVEENNDQSKHVLKNGISFFLQSQGNFIGEDCWNNFLSLIQWVAETRPENKIYIREHPSLKTNSKELEEIQKYSNVVMADPETWKIKDMLDESVIAVSIYSSTILESICMGVLPIIYNETSIPKYYPDIESENAGIEVKNLQEAKKAINMLLDDKNRLHEYKMPIKKFASHYFKRGDVLSRFNEAINQVVQTNNI